MLVTVFQPDFVLLITNLWARLLRISVVHSGTQVHRCGTVPQLYDRRVQKCRRAGRGCKVSRSFLPTAAHRTEQEYPSLGCTEPLELPAIL